MDGAASEGRLAGESRMDGLTRVSSSVSARQPAVEGLHATASGLTGHASGASASIADSVAALSLAHSEEAAPQWISERLDTTSQRYRLTSCNQSTCRERLLCAQTDY